MREGSTATTAFTVVLTSRPTGTAHRAAAVAEPDEDAIGLSESLVRNAYHLSRTLTLTVPWIPYAGHGRTTPAAGTFGRTGPRGAATCGQPIASAGSTGSGTPLTQAGELDRRILRTADQHDRAGRLPQHRAGGEPDADAPTVVGVMAADHQQAGARRVTDQSLDPVRCGPVERGHQLGMLPGQRSQRLVQAVVQRAAGLEGTPGFAGRARAWHDGQRDTTDGRFGRRRGKSPRTRGVRRPPDRDVALCLASRASGHRDHRAMGMDRDPILDRTDRAVSRPGTSWSTPTTIKAADRLSRINSSLIAPVSSKVPTATLGCASEATVALSASSRWQVVAASYRSGAYSVGGSTWVTSRTLRRMCASWAAQSTAWRDAEDWLTPTTIRSGSGAPLLMPQC